MFNAVISRAVLQIENCDALAASRLITLLNYWMLAMSTDKEMRLERIHRLLHELKYEINRGFMETEIDEFIRYEFIVPISRQVENGIVICKFETMPVHRDSIMGRQLNQDPRLKLV